MIIRHGDLGPWNTVWEGETLNGVIDWDFAGPAYPLSDVGQFAWYSVPLRGEDPDSHTSLISVPGYWSYRRVTERIRRLSWTP